MSACAPRFGFFDTLLAGRMPSAVDDQDNIFIDRSGDLFAVLLQYARTLQRPPQAVIDKHGEALLEEVRFFGVDSLEQKMKGHTCLLDLRPADRRLREVEDEARGENSQERQKLLIDVLATGVGRLPRETLELPLLLTGFGPPSLKPGTIRDFQSRLDAFSGGLLEELKVVSGHTRGAEVRECGALHCTSAS